MLRIKYLFLYLRVSLIRRTDSSVSFTLWVSFWEEEVDTDGRESRLDGPVSFRLIKLNPAETRHEIVPREVGTFVTRTGPKN